MRFLRVCKCFRERGYHHNTSSKSIIPNSAGAELYLVGSGELERDVVYLAGNYNPQSHFN